MTNSPYATTSANKAGGERQRKRDKDRKTRNNGATIRDTKRKTAQACWETNHGKTQEGRQRPRKANTATKAGKQSTKQRVQKPREADTLTHQYWKTMKGDTGQDRASEADTPTKAKMQMKDKVDARQHQGRHIGCIELRTMTVNGFGAKGQFEEHFLCKNMRCWCARCYLLGL